MNRLSVGFGLLLVFQAMLVAALWLVDPLQYVGQRMFGATLGAQLVIVAIFLHLYLSRGEDYDQEWIAVGLAFIVLIGFLTYFALTG
jgi:Na+/melibiose symporter-like transporter